MRKEQDPASSGAQPAHVGWLMGALDVEPFELFDLRLGDKKRARAGEDQMIRDVMRHPDVSVRRLTSTVVKGILQWNRGKK